MADRELVVRLIGDDKDLQRAFDRSAKSAQRFDSRVQGLQRNAIKAGSAVGLAFGAREVVQQLFSAVDAASSLNEEINKSTVIFGASAREVKAWSETTADSMGISQRAALAAAGGFGQILETSGIVQKDSADMSRSLVSLAADIASFNNIDPSEALEKLRSGLAGEAEPLRTVGVLLSEARVKREAYISGIAKEGAVLTEGQKVQARYKLILQDTAKAQGDFGRTSESLANKQRVLNARTEELRAKIGNGLIPIELAAVDATLKLEGAFVSLAHAIDRLPGGADFKLTDILPGGKEFKLLDLFNDGLKEQADILRQNAAAARDAASAHAEGERVDRQRIQTGALLGNVLTRNQALETQVADKIRQRTAEQKRAAASVSNVPAETRNRIFDRQIGRAEDRVQDIKSLRGQLAQLDVIADLLQEQIRKVKDNERKETLLDELRSVRRRQSGIRDEIAQNRRDAAEARKQAAEQRRAEAERQREEARRLAERRKDLAERAKIARIAAEQAKQFRTLGLAADGSDPVAGVGALTRRLGTLRDQVKGTVLDTPKTAAEFKRIAAVLAEGPKKVGRDVRAAIQQMFKDINDALDDGGGTEAKVVGLNTNKALSGLGLSREQERALRARLSHVSSTGQQLAPTGVSQSAFGQPVSGGAGNPLVVQVNLDSKTIATSTVDHVTVVQQRNRKRNPQQTRGRVTA